ncbi:MAG: uracil-DNA glycosylase [Syntrophomonadaceae bacterium]|jgi:uracil-DNA glycosylase family 4
MSTEQLDLFGEFTAPQKEPEPEAKNVVPYITFLPGVKAQAAYPLVNNYNELLQIAKECQKCGLRKGCRQVVFGDGNPQAQLMLIGEGPGQDEDIKGIPFVGRAGQLLDKILSAATIDRNKIYIANVVKCRPPGNRLPNPDEFKECRNYLEAQIRIIKPRIIVCLGALASQVVIDPRARIGQIRGKWFLRNNIKIIATYHPAALLRNEGYKRPTWEDFKLIRDELKNLAEE